MMMIILCLSVRTASVSVNEEYEIYNDTLMNINLRPPGD